MRQREVKKLLLRIVESLFRASKDGDKAWEGTLVDIGGRVGLSTSDGELLEIDHILPRGETGRLMIIWTQGDVEEPKSKI